MALNQSSIKKSVTQQSNFLTKDYSLKELEKIHQKRTTEVNKLISHVLKSCEMASFDQCPAWQNLHQELVKDLRRVFISSLVSILQSKVWIQTSIDLLSHSENRQRNLGANILLIVTKRLKFRHLPLRNELILALNEELDDFQNSPYVTKLIYIFSYILPLGQGDFFYKFTKPHVPPEVQVAVWDVLSQRHSKQEPIKLSQVIRAMKHASAPFLKASLIKAATPLKLPQMIKWCGKEWWQNELFIPCRNALMILGNKRAAIELWKWTKNLFIEVDQALDADRQIAEALTYLSYCTKSKRAEKRYLKLLDRFFSRRRSEQASIEVAQSWLTLPNKRFAMEVSLRYLRPKHAKIETQSHFFEQHLRKVILQLSSAHY